MKMKISKLLLAALVATGSAASMADYWRPAACRTKVTSPITVYATITGVNEDNFVTAVLPQGLHQTGRQSLRLMEISTPAAGQLLADTARHALTDWVTGKWVRIEIHGHDPHCFPLVEIHDELGSVNLRLVEKGLAWATQYPRADGRFLNAEMRARKGKRGLWTDTTAVHPARRRSAKIESDV